MTRCRIFEKIYRPEQTQHYDAGKGPVSYTEKNQSDGALSGRMPVIIYPVAIGA